MHPIAKRRPVRLSRLSKGLLGSRQAAGRFGRQLLRETLGHHFGLGLRRAYSGATVEELDRLFDEPLPERGQAPAAVHARCRATLFRHSMQMSHPRIFGLFNPSPLPIAAFAELPAAFLNQSVDAWKAAPAATHLEKRLIRWMTDLIGFGPNAFGVFTSGGGIANTIALKMARDRALGHAARARGVPARWAGRLRVYASDQAHFSIGRSLDILGLGEDSLVRVPSDHDLRMRPEALAASLALDRKRGLRPIAVVATAGTTNTGTIDPLRPLAAIARVQRLHCHVDAAYGGALLFSNRYRDRLKGIEEADSVTIDPHKWLFQPFSLGGLFVRDGRALGRSFHTEPDYLRKDLESEPHRLDFYHFSMEGSRPFRGLKFWFTLKTLGREGLGDLVDRTMEIAFEIERQVRADGHFEILPVPVDLASVCFRYRHARPRGRPGPGPGQPAGRARLNRLQKMIQQEIERSGFAWFPTIVLRGDVYFRFGVFNYSTTERDVAAVLQRIRRVGARLASKA